METVLRVAIVCLLSVSLASAAFVNGVDSFDGPIRDINTWELFENHPNQVFSQDNAVRIDSYDYSPRFNANGDYTTITITIGVGESVRAEVTSMEGADEYGHFGLMLTDDARGFSGTIFSDNAMLMLQGTGNGGGNVIRAGYNNGSNGSHYVLETVSPNIHPIGTTYVYQIERLSSTSARFSVFADDGVSPIGTPLVMNFTNVPDDLYIAVATASADAIFDNVTIVPEPVSCVLLAIGGCLLRRRR